MPLQHAAPVTLTAAERKALKKRARGAKTAYRDWLRAQIVLAAARGRANARIATDLGVSTDTARKWRGRFAARGLDGLKDLPRTGRPRRISALERAAVVALACQLPAATGVPLSRWTGPELAAEITGAVLAAQISPSSILRILAEHPIKPWQYQSWIFPRDPVGKMPTTSVRRRSSLFSRSWGLELQIWRQISRATAVKASRSGSAADRCPAAAGSLASSAVTTRLNWACTSAASGWPKIVRTRVATHGWLVLLTLVSRSRR